jgi:phage-related protein
MLKKIGGDGVGFKLNDIHSDSFKGLSVNTVKIPFIPEMTDTEVEVEGRDSVYIVQGKYKPIIIELDCQLYCESLFERRKIGRYIASWLNNKGMLILDSEPDIAYTVIKSISNLEIEPIGFELDVDEFSLKFVCYPHPTNNFYNDEVTWGELESLWGYTDITWGGGQRIFTVTNGSTVSLINSGTYKALPIVKMEGIAINVTIGDFTYTNLNGVVFIDSINQLVYSVENNVKVNKIQNFSGKFPEVNPGENVFPVSGSITNLTVEYDYKNTFI